MPTVHCRSRSAWRTETRVGKDRAESGTTNQSEEKGVGVRKDPESREPPDRYPVRAPRVKPAGLEDKPLKASMHLRDQSHVIRLEHDTFSGHSFSLLLGLGLSESDQGSEIPRRSLLSSNGLATHGYPTSTQGLGFCELASPFRSFGKPSSILFEFGGCSTPSFSDIVLDSRVTA